MQKRRLLQYFRSLFALAVLFLLALLPLANNLIAEESSASHWLSTQLKHRVESVITGSEAQNSVLSSIDGGHCWEYEFRLKNTRNGISYPKEKVGCAVDTIYGVSAGLYFHENGEKYAGRLHPTNIMPYTLPNSTDLVALDRSGSSYVMKQYEDFAVNADIGNVNGTENTYQLQNPAIIKDKAGFPLRFRSTPPRSSKSGDWLLANRFGGGVIRVNINAQDGDPLPFGERETYSLYTISNDGNNAVTYHFQQETLTIYDLTFCSPVPDRITRPVDCQSRELGDYLSEQLGKVERVERIEFLDDYHLRLFVKHLNENNKLVLSEIQLTTTNHDFLELAGGYIAMGDSFASGEGDMDSNWYEVGTDEPENKCHLSRRSYPYLLNQALELGEFHSVACSGAETVHVIDDPQNDNRQPVSSLGDWTPGIEVQIDYLSIPPSVLTISIGGNDIGFASKLTECVLGPGTCKFAEHGEFRANTAKEIAYLHNTLIETYEKLIAKTEGKTKIFAVGYPQFIKADGGSCGLNVHLNDAERKFIHEGVAYMNQVIKSAAEEVGIHYLDIEHSLEGANLCSEVEDSKMSVNGLTYGDDKKLPSWLNAAANPILTAGGLIPVNDLGIGNESFHPNQNGHQHMKNSILDQTASNPAVFTVCADSGDVVCPRGDGSIPIPSQYWTESASDYVNQLNGGSTKAPALHKSFIQNVSNFGKKALINMTNLKPLSTVSFTLFSEPTDLGSFQADEQGKLSIEFTIPDSIEPGFHTLSATGQETAGDPFEYYQPVFIVGTEGDLDTNEILDTQQQCAFVLESGIDADSDGIDDACDALIEGQPINHTISNEPQVQHSHTAQNAYLGDSVKNEESTENPIEAPRVIVNNIQPNTSTVSVAGATESNLESSKTKSESDSAIEAQLNEQNLLNPGTLVAIGAIGLAYAVHRYSVKS